MKCNYKKRSATDFNSAADLFAILGIEYVAKKYRPGLQTHFQIHNSAELLLQNFRK